LLRLTVRHLLIASATYVADPDGPSCHDSVQHPNRADLEAEILALRYQLAVLQRAARTRPRLSHADRLFWVLLSWVWTGWRRTVHIVQPATVVCWHRRLFAWAQS
jgi:hypothetical protein